MNSVSSNDTGRQQPDRADRPDLLHVPFDLHAETVPGEPVAGHPDDDGGDFDHDGDTDLADILAGFDGDDPPPPVSGACGLPCRQLDANSRRPRTKYSLCAVVIAPDPGYPAETDDPDYIEAGQELCRSSTRSTVQALCDGLAITPELLTREYRLGVNGCTHLMVNDAKGREIYRREIVYPDPVRQAA